MLARMLSDRNSHVLLMGMQNATLEDSLAVTHKAKHSLHLMIDPRRQPLGDVGLNPSSTMNRIPSTRQSTSHPVHGYPHLQKGIICLLSHQAAGNIRWDNPFKALRTAPGISLTIARSSVLSPSHSTLPMPTLYPCSFIHSITHSPSIG